MEQKQEQPKPMMWNLQDVKEARHFIEHTIVVDPGPVEKKITFITNNQKQHIPLDRACDALVMSAIRNLLRGNEIIH